MEHVWTWSGRYFGYFDGDNLWTYHGKHIGKRNGDNIYGSDGMYLGEVMNENRLITKISKKSWKGYVFTPFSQRVSFTKLVDYGAYGMYGGYEDFPNPEIFK